MILVQYYLTALVLYHQVNALIYLIVVFQVVTVIFIVPTQAWQILVQQIVITICKIITIIIHTEVITIIHRIVKIIHLVDVANYIKVFHLHFKLQMICNNIHAKIKQMVIMIGVLGKFNLKKNSKIKFLITNEY